MESINTTAGNEQQMATEGMHAANIEAAAGSTAVNIVDEALAAARKADELRDGAIESLRQQQAEIERNLRALGYIEPMTPQKVHNGVGHGTNGTVRSAARTTPAASAPVAAPVADNKRFRDIPVADICRTLLEEHEVLHGKLLEKLAKAGGYNGGTANFQNYLPVALRRAGGFENTGGNTWRLNSSIKANR